MFPIVPRILQNCLQSSGSLSVCFHECSRKVADIGDTWNSASHMDFTAGGAVPRGTCQRSLRKIRRIVWAIFSVFKKVSDSVGDPPLANWRYLSH